MDILSLARQAGFHELESEDIEQVLASHTEELTNEDLQLLTEHSAAKDDDEEEEPQRTLTTKRMAEVFDMIQQGMQIRRCVEKLAQAPPKPQSCL
ncbi:putative Tigger transposable element-derived protein 1-like 271 [Homarus americanus]|uniref:Putative Tigger transposable element-derived protein 1-like 271 n=1 Tax=Homarus americanus TaxID=6706 RepID=A0A8J5K192_HOMAM|nr:putative Tigger transposable element-derived protein 1-like 271 [Homarus americanus]